MKVDFECLVLGLNVTGLGVLQTLGMRGIPIAALDKSNLEIGNFSAFGQKYIVPDSNLVSWLLSLEQVNNSKILLIPTSDDYLILLSRHRSELERIFLLPFPENDLVEKLLNKYQFYLLASQHCDNIPFCERLHESTFEIWDRWPSIVKPVYIHEFRKHFPNCKAWVVNSSAELEVKRHILEDYGIEAFVQEIVSGPDSDQFSVCVYLDAKSCPKTAYVARKVRQDPRGFGVGTYVELVSDSELIEPTIELLQKIEYKGIAEVEYRRDSRDGLCKIIEINARAWTQNKLGAYSGNDVIGAAYTDMTGNHLSSLDIKARRWTFAFRDIKGIICEKGSLKDTLKQISAVGLPWKDLVGAISNKKDIKVLIGMPIYIIWKLYSFMRSINSNG